VTDILKDLNEQVYCMTCNGKKNHKIVRTYETKSNYDEDYQWHMQYHIVKCAGCDRVAFVEQSGNEN